MEALRHQNARNVIGTCATAIVAVTAVMTVAPWIDNDKYAAQYRHSGASLRGDERHALTSPPLPRRRRRSGGVGADASALPLRRC